MSQSDFFNELGMNPEQNSDSNKKEFDQNKPKSDTENILGVQKLDDGLDFECEICSGREGGCAQCGFGRKK